MFVPVRHVKGLDSLREGKRDYPLNKTLTAVRVLSPDRNSSYQLSRATIALSINP